MLKRTIALTTTLLCTAAALAQTLPAGWQVTKQDSQSTLYNFKGGEGVVVVAEQSGMSAEKLEPAFTTLLNQVKAVPDCAPKGDITIRNIASRLGRWAEWNGVRAQCGAYALVSGKNQIRIAMSIQKPTSTANAGGFALAQLQRGVDLPQMARPGANPGQQVQPPKMGAATDSDLGAAAARVPKNRLPLDIVFRPETVTYTSGLLVNSYVVGMPWLIFGNGFATNCFDWDPQHVEPTPAGLARIAKAKECDVFRWRRAGAGVQIVDSDGDAGPVLDLGKMRRFTPGQRIAINKETHESSIGITTTIMTHADVTVKRLIMDKTGRVSFGEESQSWRGGDNTQVANVNSARYYLDGFLMVIGFPNGQIERRFLGYVVEEGKSYYYWLGAQFYDPD